MLDYILIFIAGAAAALVVQGLIWLFKQDRPQLTGGTLVFIVKDDHPDVNYAISGVQATDSEGNPVDAGTLTYEVSSDNDAAVAITPDADDQTKGTVHFGAPGQANINVNVKTAGGTLLGAFGAQFTVTAGDPAAITGGSIQFDGLTDS